MTSSGPIRYPSLHPVIENVFDRLLHVTVLSAIPGRDAIEIFKAVDGFGLSRVDFFVDENGQPVFNEINTLPGFTAISMYPMLWEKQGISKKELVAKLIENALKREAH